MIVVGLKKILFEKDNMPVQFAKYALCGGVAMAVDAVVFFLMVWLVFPALTENDQMVRWFHLKVVMVPEYMRTINFCIDNGIAFLVSNFTAYLLNVRFVFKSGRHSRRKEVGLFYLVSAISVGIGTAVGAILINGLGLSTSFSYVAKAVSTTLINYAARKFIIFHR